MLYSALTLALTPSEIHDVTSVSASARVRCRGNSILWMRPSHSLDTDTPRQAGTRRLEIHALNKPPPSTTLSGTNHPLSNVYKRTQYRLQHRAQSLDRITYALDWHRIMARTTETSSSPRSGDAQYSARTSKHWLLLLVGHPLQICQRTLYISPERCTFVMRKEAHTQN